MLATELEDEDRVGFLERHCGADEALRAELEALLVQDDEGTRDFLSRPAPLTGAGTSNSLEPGLPERVGRYRLIERIGEGGMGSVWLCEQAEPVRRRVAVKFLRAGSVDERRLQRFQAECQVLALMDHAGIASIYDAGTTEGRPWFAMEYAPGCPIDESCDREARGLRDRLELFLRVCDAVSHAHQKGVVHRDIKPSNILVSESQEGPVLKLIDFGIAWDVNGSLPGGAKGAAGTCAYMSPEQADPTRSADTRSDVFSLGALLFQLLTGTSPFAPARFRGLDLAECAEVIAASEPPLPSESTVRHPWARSLKGDLDWIVGAALARDPDERYSSVPELRADVERYLRCEAVRVAPRSRAYRLRKTVGRNRLVVGAAALVLVAVVVGVVGSVHGLLEASRERDRATRSADQSSAVAAFLADTLALADPSITLSPHLTVQTLLDSASARVDGAFSGGGAAEATVRRVIGDAYKSLGQLEPAERHLRRALELQERSGASASEELYATVWSLVEVYDESNLHKAIEFASRSVALRLQWISSEQPGLAERLEELYPLVAEGKCVAATELARTLVADAQAVIPDHHPLWIALADAIGDLGFALDLSGAHLEALPLLTISVDVHRTQLPRGHPQTARSEAWLVGAQMRSARFDDASRVLDELLAASEGVLPSGHWLLSEARSRRGECMAAKGAIEEAETELVEAQKALAEVYDFRTRASLEAGLRLAGFLDGCGRNEDAEAARAAVTPALATSSAIVFWESRQAAFGPEWAGLVERLTDLERMAVASATGEQLSEIALGTAVDEALDAMRLALWNKPHLGLLVARQAVVWSHLLVERYPEMASRLVDVAVSVIRAREVDVPESLSEAHFVLGRVALHRGRASEALDQLRKSWAMQRQLFGERSYSSLKVAVFVARALVATGRAGEAEELLLDAYDSCESTRGDGIAIRLFIASEAERHFQERGMRGVAARWAERIAELGRVQ